MDTKLKIQHQILPFFIIPILCLISGLFGYMAFATITEQPGANGHFYEYLNLNKIQYFVYNLLITAIAFGFLVLILKYTWQKQTRHLNKTYVFFLIFFALLILCEIYLQSRFSKA